MTDISKFMQQISNSLASNFYSNPFSISNIPRNGPVHIWNRNSKRQINFFLRIIVLLITYQNLKYAGFKLPPVFENELFEFITHKFTLQFLDFL